LEPLAGPAVWWSRCAWSVELRPLSAKRAGPCPFGHHAGPCSAPAQSRRGCFKKKPRRSGAVHSRSPRKGPWGDLLHCPFLRRSCPSGKVPRPDEVEWFRPSGALWGRADQAPARQFQSPGTASRGFFSEDRRLPAGKRKPGGKRLGSTQRSWQPSGSTRLRVTMQGHIRELAKKATGQVPEEAACHGGEFGVGSD
jgi:hypothetical protein